MAAIAPEQCLRLLHQIDTDLDEMISLEDMQAYVQRHSLPIGVEEMAAMFDEANVTRNGLLDIDQLENLANMMGPGGMGGPGMGGGGPKSQTKNRKEEEDDDDDRDL